MRICVYSILAIWGIIIAMNLVPYLDVCLSISILNRFINATYEKNSCQREMNAALRRYPAIKRYTKNNKLSHKLSEFSNKENSIQILGELCDIRDDKLHDLCTAINPFHAAPKIFSFPSYAVSLLGVRQHDAAKLVVDAVFWMVEFLSGVFSNEIKEFIVSNLL